MFKKGHALIAIKIFLAFLDRYYQRYFYGKQNTHVFCNNDHQLASFSIDFYIFILLMENLDPLAAANNQQTVTTAAFNAKLGNKA